MRNEVSLTNPMAYGEKDIEMIPLDVRTGTVIVYVCRRLRLLFDHCLPTTVETATQAFFVAIHHTDSVRVSGYHKSSNSRF